MHSSGEFHSAENGLLCLPISTDSPQGTLCLTLNIGERPRVPNPTKLSQILEPDADPKYDLSAKACQGILNRAERRGKILPEALKAALIAQANGGGITKAFSLQGNGIDRKLENGCNGKGWAEDVCYTLNTIDRHAVYEDVTDTAEPENSDVILFEPRSQDGVPRIHGDISPTLNTCGGGKDSPAYFASSNEPTIIEMTSTKNTIVTDGISPTLTARMGTGGNQVNAVFKGE